ncbi:MAG TPA: hypothetical protein VLE53_00295 [Gemmatimonadaceae bacterium]|nr:hypothetical protein [Gemmatimonadaceae bacterium]
MSASRIPRRGATAAMGRARRTLARLLGLAVIAMLSSAHVGTFDSFFVGEAGPYRVQVTVRAPGVVPGLAQITVRVPDPGVRRVTTQAARWNLGTRGAPRPDEAVRVPGDSALWASELWLMTSGAHAIHVAVEGPAGSGRVTVPYNSVATRQLEMRGALSWILAGLGLFLVAGLASIVGASARDAILPAGAPLDRSARRRGRVATAVGAAVIVLGLLGGRAWWNRVDAAYRSGLFRPLPSQATVRVDSGVPVLRLTMDGSEWSNGVGAPLVPDHGKLMHLFLVRLPGMEAFAHLHPARVDSFLFETAVPALPAGAYRYYADIVHESGFAQTMTGSVTLPDGEGSARLPDPDDAVLAGTPASGDSTGLGDGVRVVWERPARLVAGEEARLRFRVRDAAGAPVLLEPYLGMPGHAMIAREDGEVFVHLHAMGTVSAAAIAVLEALERGDTLASRRPYAPRPRLDAVTDAPVESDHGAHAVTSDLDFPFAFPRPGRYGVWVQVRVSGTVRTAAFVVDVAAERRADRRVSLRALVSRAKPST